MKTLQESIINERINSREYKDVRDLKKRIEKRITEMSEQKKLVKE